MIGCLLLGALSAQKKSVAALVMDNFSLVTYSRTLSIYYAQATWQLSSFYYVLTLPLRSLLFAASHGTRLDFTSYTI